MIGENLTPARESLRRTWEEHLHHEFETKDTEETLATMVEDAHVNHVPVMTDGVGREGLRESYSKRLISQMPPDVEIVPISRTIGSDQLVDTLNQAPGKWRPGAHPRAGDHSCKMAPSPMRHL